MGSLSVIVPNSHTNILPYVKIQDVPNVTKDEWHWLKQIVRNEVKIVLLIVNLSSSNPTKWSDSLKQFVGTSKCELANHVFHKVKVNMGQSIQEWTK